MQSNGNHAGRMVTRQSQSEVEDRYMKGLLLIILLSLSSSAFASTIGNTKIKSILAGEVYGYKVFLEIDPKPSSIPSCQTNPDYNLPRRMWERRL